MEIKIKNKIKVGDQTEIIEEIHTCEEMCIRDSLYISHKGILETWSLTYFLV